MLYGSRARGSHTARSDWDFGYIATSPFDPEVLLARLLAALETDRIDLADLDRANGLLRFRTARDGIVVFEPQAGIADRFRLAAAQFWCDVAPLLERGYDDVLARLDGASPLDRAVLAERAMAVERHLRRVAERLPDSTTALEPATDASDAVILHLWQATQVVIDLAMTACLALDLGTPSIYGDAFRRLQQADVIEQGLADRLVKAAGFRNVVAHAYDTIDMQRVYRAAIDGPADLRAFLARLRERAQPA